MKRVVSLYLPTWPTDRLRRRLGAAAPGPDVPVALVGRQGASRLVLSVDAPAARLGLRQGMAATEAQALHPGLAVFDAEPEEDAAGLVRLAAWALRRYSPVVAADPPDGLVLDVTGATHLHGGEEETLADLVSRLAAAGYAARCAMAGTAGAAHALARHHPRPIVAMDTASGRKALASLPVASLRLSPVAVRGLRTLGFETVGDLVAQPRAPLVRRFGPDLGRRIDQALGDVAEPVTPVEVSDVVSVSKGFPDPVSATETLERHVGLLADGLSAALERRGLGARRVDLLLHRVDGNVAGVRVGTAAPSRDPRHLARLFREKLGKIDPGFGIERLTLSATVAEPLAARAGTDPFGERPRPGMATLVDTLAARVGDNRLYRLALVESDVPERSVARVAPMAAPAAAAARIPQAWPRPMRLLPAPEPIATIALLPDHPPASFTWRGVRHRVVRADGPERIHGEWIRSEAEADLVRDYFAVEDEAGLRFWLFRRGEGPNPDVPPHAWFLHGLFA